MLRYTSTPSRLYTASCFVDNDHTAEDSTPAGENSMLKQPLIMSHESLEQDEEQTKLQEKERQSRSIICKSFLLGSSIGFALQVMSFAACYALFKMFGKDAKPTPGSLLSSFSYCLLVLISHLDLAIYTAIWLMFFMYTITKSGSLYMRKKFDKDAANPNSGSIWTTRMLFIVGVYFLVGLLVGSFFPWVIVDLSMGMVISLNPLFRFMMIEFVIFIVMVKCFDLSHTSTTTSGYTTEPKLEDDLWLVV
jgi:hypothetical protein